MKKIATESRPAEKEIFVSTDPHTRLAAFISTVANPLFVVVPLFLVVILHSAPDILHGILWWMITLLGMTVAPYLFIQHGVHSGKYSDHHISDRTQRLIPLIFGLGCMVIALAFLILLHTSITLLTTATAIIVLLAICIAVTLKWKVSLHTAWAASVIMILTFVFGPFYLLLAPLVVLVAWARWQVHAHTLWQLLAGTVLAILIVSITFGVFRL